MSAPRDDTARYTALVQDVVRWRRALDGGIFEETYQALEEIVERLEQGHLRLEDTLACYELGMRLAARCGRILDDAELRVTRLDDALGGAGVWDEQGDFAEDDTTDPETE